MLQNYAALQHEEILLPFRGLSRDKI